MHVSVYGVTYIYPHPQLQANIPEHFSRTGDQLRRQGSITMQ
jgi:hypothetical protein